MVDDLDADGSGEIDFGEFLEMMTTKGVEEGSKEEYEKMFKLFDDGK
mgnify:CR=1 FL=1